MKQAESPKAVITRRFVKLLHENIGKERLWKNRAQAVDALGIFPQELHRMEIGEGHVQFHHLIALHEFVKADMNYLIIGNEKEKINNIEKRVLKLEKEVKELKRK